MNKKIIVWLTVVTTRKKNEIKLIEVLSLGSFVCYFNQKIDAKTSIYIPLILKFDLKLYFKI